MTQDEALKQALEALRMPCNYWNKTQFIKVQEAIAAAEKALAQPAQEPIGYLCENATGHRYFRWKKPPSVYNPIALYAKP